MDRRYVSREVPAWRGSWSGETSASHGLSTLGVARIAEWLDIARIGLAALGVSPARQGSRSGKTSEGVERLSETGHRTARSMEWRGQASRRNARLGAEPRALASHGPATQDKARFADWPRMTTQGWDWPRKARFAVWLVMERPDEARIAARQGVLPRGETGHGLACRGWERPGRRAVAGPPLLGALQLSIHPEIAPPMNRELDNRLVDLLTDLQFSHTLHHRLQPLAQRQRFQQLDNTPAFLMLSDELQCPADERGEDEQERDQRGHPAVQVCSRSLQSIQTRDQLAPAGLGQCRNGCQPGIEHLP